MEGTQQLTCSECGTTFERPGARGPIPTRCMSCREARRRKRHAAEEQRRLERRAAGRYRCGRCGEEKVGSDFAPSQMRDGGWCRACFRETYVERSGGVTIKHCEVCGEPFEVTRRDRRRKYCSKRCKRLAAARRESARLLESKAGRVCAGCGGEIPAELLSSAIYCSEDCRRTHAGPEIRRRSMLKRLYGLTLDRYQALVEKQGGCCAICHSADPGAKGIWHIDHCHNGGHVRGLLCSACNTGLGQFKDRPEVLRAAADYLERNA